MEDLLTPAEMYEFLKTPEIAPAVADTDLSPIEQLYAVFEDHYDEPSIDAAYLMNGCQFEPSYEMLMMPFWTAQVTPVPSSAPRSINEKVPLKIQRPSKPAGGLTPVAINGNGDHITTEISLADFIVPDKRKRKH